MAAYPSFTARTTLRALLTLPLLFAAAHAAKSPPGYATEIARNRFEKSRGDWMKPANWELGHLPNDKEWAVISNNTAVTLSEKAPPIQSINIGGRTLSALSLEKSASLSVAIVRVRAQQNEGVSLLELKDGYLGIAQNTEKNTTGGLFIGDSGTFSSTGIVRLSGGRFEGRGITIGTNIPDRGVGTLSIVGSMAEVTTQRDHTGARMVVFAGSAVEFVLDADGVSPIDYSRTGALLKKDALVRVDGSRYQGKKTTIPLILGKGVTDEGARLECVGFPPERQAKIERTAAGLQLKLAR